MIPDTTRACRGKFGKSTRGKGLRQAVYPDLIAPLQMLSHNIFSQNIHFKMYKDILLNSNSKFIVINLWLIFARTLICPIL